MFFNCVLGAKIDVPQILSQLRMLIEQIHQMSCLSEVLRLISSQTRTILGSERVVIYRFGADGDEIVHEELATPQLLSIREQLACDSCCANNWLQQYKSGQLRVVEDIEAYSQDLCYKQILTKLQIRAELTLPILINSQDNQEADEYSLGDSHLWGLLVAYQCSDTRQWHPIEIEFLQLLTTQLAIFIQQTQQYDKFLQLYQYLPNSTQNSQQSSNLKQTDSQLHCSEIIINRKPNIFEESHERRQLEKRLHLSDYSFECMGISGTWIDSNAKILRVNQAACDFLGYSRAELESMYVYQVDPDFPKHQWTAHWQELKQQKHMTFISHHRHKNGEIIPVEITLNYVKFDGEEYNFAFARDISEQLAAQHERIQAQTALKQSEELYRCVVTTMAEGILLQQADGHITAYNPSAGRILGLSVPQMMGQVPIDEKWQLIDENGLPLPDHTHLATTTLRTGQPQYNLIMGVHKVDGSLSWVSINSQPLFPPDDSTPYAVVASFTDITELKQAQQALQKRMQQERMIYTISTHIRQSLDLDDILNTSVAEFRQFLNGDRVIIYRFNSDGSGVVVTESVIEPWQPILNLEITDAYFAQTIGQISGQEMMTVTPNIYTAGFSPCYIELLQQLQVKAKLVVPILQASQLWGLLIVHNCHAPRQWQLQECELLQQLATQLAIAIQQSELYQQLQTANHQLQQLVMTDPLTGIANRRYFDIQLDCVWQQLLRERDCISLLLCDIDFFKQYNDTYGHAVGDNCLRLVAGVFEQILKRSSDLAARYGGEEFAIILPHTNSDGAAVVAQQIHQALHNLNVPHSTSSVDQRVTLSIGIATVMPSPQMLPLDLLQAADEALYQAKAQGRNCSFIHPLFNIVLD